MHKSLRHLQPQQDILPLTTNLVWQQLPTPRRQQCHEFIAQLLIHVIHSAPSKEQNHEPQD
jgi:hypothetical protein